jgi:pimeloyl-ACP methyl ester carboxylesterase
VVRRLRLFIVRLVLATLAVAVFFILTQDFQIFPRVWDKIFSSFSASNRPIPTRVEGDFIPVGEGNKVEAWYLKGEKNKQFNGYTAFFLFGNGDSLERFGTQVWLSSMGFDTIVYSYRGYGRSTGWPSADAFRADTLKVWEHMAGRYGLEPKNTVVLGHSLGTGPAIWLAKHIRPKSLTLYASYRSLREIVNDRPFLRYLRSFLWNDFYNEKILNEEGNLADCMLMFHGRHDRVISPQHTEALAKYLERSKGKHQVTICEHCGHNDILEETVPLYEKFQAECFGLESQPKPQVLK